jgi:2-dehydropantoate 2-reductase
MLKPEQLGVIECALVSADANATPQTAKVAASCLSRQGFALSLQNGIGNVEALGEALGLEKVVAGSTYDSGATLGLARVLHSNAGATWIGEAVGGSSERVCHLARRMTAAGLPITVSENVMSAIWSRFVHNCAINAVSAITGLRPGEIARNPAAAWIMKALLDEILAVVDELASTCLNPILERKSTITPGSVTTRLPCCNTSRLDALRRLMRSTEL